MISSNKQLSSNRVEFAHFLRGIAAFSVLVSHFLGLFWLNNEAVKSLLHVENGTWSAPAFVVAVNFSLSFNYGAFGVAVFFLISGFVIPFSVTRLSTRGFLVARFFRIYPVYIVCLSVSLLTLLLSVYLEDSKEWNYSASHVISQVLLLRGWFWLSSIDEISWTLEIEIVFYLLAAFLVPKMLKPNMGALLPIIYAFVVFLLCAVLTANLDLLSGMVLQTIVLYATFCLPFTIFMFIGTLFYFASSQHIHLSQLAISVLVLTWFFLMSLKLSTSLQVLDYTSYLLAIMVFTLFWFAREGFSSNIFTNWLANISYPLYAVHPVFGYFFMYKATMWGMHPVWVICLVFPLVIIAAWVIHILVEEPARKLGKKWAKRLTKIES